MRRTRYEMVCDACGKRVSEGTPELLASGSRGWFHLKLDAYSKGGSNIDKIIELMLYADLCPGCASVASVSLRSALPSLESNSE